MANAKHYDIIDAVADVIVALNLTSITSNVVQQRLPTDRDLTLPVVIVSHGSEMEAKRPGTNAQDDWGYPVLVSIVQAANQDKAINNNLLYWREQIRNAFHNKRMSAISTNYQCEVEPRPIFDVGLWSQENIDVSTMCVRVWSRELRS
jgi:hypothetical protein